MSKLSFKSFAQDAPMETKNLGKGQVEQALHNAGYLDQIRSAVYVGESPSSGSIYNITFADPDSEAGVGNGKVYVRVANGRLEAHY